MNTGKISVYIDGIQYFGNVLDNNKILVDIKPNDFINELDNALADYKKQIHKNKLEVIEKYLRGDKYIYTTFDEFHTKKYVKNLRDHIYRYIHIKKTSEYGSTECGIIYDRVEYDMSPIINKYKNYDYTNLFECINKKYDIFGYYLTKEYLRNLFINNKDMGMSGLTITIFIILSLMALNVFCLHFIYTILSNISLLTMLDVLYILMILVFGLIEIFLTFVLVKKIGLQLSNMDKKDSYLKTLLPLFTKYKYEIGKHYNYK